MLVVLATCSAAFPALAPATATAGTVTPAGVCQVNAHLSLIGGGLITALPSLVAAPSYTLTGSSGGTMCQGQPQTPIYGFNWSGLLEISCDAMLAENGGGSITFNWGSPRVTAMNGVGLGPLQQWSFSNGQFNVIAQLVWTNPTQIAACHTVGTNAMDLTGILIYQDPNLP